MENLDSRLLSGQEQENDAAGELRRRQSRQTGRNKQFELDIKFMYN